VIDNGDVIAGPIPIDVMSEAAHEGRLLFSGIHDDLDYEVVYNIPGKHVLHQDVFLLVFQVIAGGASSLAEPRPHSIEEYDDALTVVRNFRVWLVAHFLGLSAHHLSFHHGPSVFGVAE